MRDGIGSIFLYNIIIVFILLIFAFLAAIVSYNKAFTINSRIVGIIEKYEGYNGLAFADIQKDLSSIGYRQSGNGMDKCPERSGADLETPKSIMSGNKIYQYCVYDYGVDSKTNHYRYGVTTYISFDFPFVDTIFNLPIYSETDSMYNYSRSFGG